MECLQQVVWDASPKKEEQAVDMYTALVNELSAQVVVENVLQHRGRNGTAQTRGEAKYLKIQTR